MVSLPDLAQHRAARAIEQCLGNPAEPTNPFGTLRSLELDEREEYPEQACRLLDRWNIQRYYVPAAQGGGLASFEEALAVLQAVARRDLGVALSHAGSLLGAVTVWIAGSETQKSKLGRMIRTGERIAFAASERTHGSDLLANEVAARREGDRYVLSGEKWPFGNATRCGAVTVLARTRDEGGPRGFSLFLVDLREVDGSSFTRLPKTRTHGIRSGDIGGIHFSECGVPGDTLVGQEGQGLELTLTGLQITKTLLAGLSVGTADAALRTTLSSALARRLYGGSIFDIPYPRRMLVACFVDLLICDALTIAATRALQAVPASMSVWSAVVKYLVPTLLESVLHDASIVLGARGYLRDEPEGRLFQKLRRDYALVGLVEGSTLVNLQAIAAQLKSLAGSPAKRTTARQAVRSPTFEHAFALQAPLPAPDWQALQLFNGGDDPVVRGLETTLDRLEQMVADATVDSQVAADMLRLARQLLGGIDALDRRIADVTRQHGSAPTHVPALFDLARIYAYLHAAATCLQLWVYSRDTLGGCFADGHWLVVGLSRLLAAAGDPPGPVPEAYYGRVGEQLLALYDERRCFSIVPLPLA